MISLRTKGNYPKIIPVIPFNLEHCIVPALQGKHQLVAFILNLWSVWH